MHTRDPKLAALSNAELGKRFAMECDAISVGRTCTHPQDLMGLRRLMWEAAARLHPNYPGENPKP